MQITVVGLNGLEDSRIEPTYRKKSTMGCSIKNITLRKTSPQVRFLLLSRSRIVVIQLKPGKGTITINGKKADDYLTRMQSRMVILQSLELLSQGGKFDAKVTVTGGGESGQAGAIRLGITRALIAFNPEFKGVLKKAGFSATVPNTTDEVKEMVDYVTIRESGKGCAREVMDLVRYAQNIHPQHEEF